MNIIAWIVLGVIAGYIAGFLVHGAERLGFVGHVALGIVGALVGGYLASMVLDVRDPIQGPLDVSTIVVSVVGAVILISVANLLSGGRRIGRGPI